MRRNRAIMGCLCIAAAALLALAGCRGEPDPPAPAPPDPTPTAEPQPAPAEPAAPVWEEVPYRETYTAPDGALVMTVTYTFPRLAEDHPAAAAINRRYEAEAEALLAAASGTSTFGVGDYETAMQVGYDFMPFLEDHSFSIARQTADYVSVRRELYTNYGGPHPGVFLFAEQFSLADGRALGFADFFPDQEAAAGRILSAIAADPVLADSGLAAEAQAAFSTDRFYVTDEGFTFWYPAGTFGAQNSPLECTVPYEAVADLAALW